MERKTRKINPWRLVINPSQQSVNFQRWILNTVTRTMAKTPEKALCDKIVLDTVPAEAINGWAHPDGRTLLYLHGGGYIMGSIRTHRPLAAILSRLSKSRGVIIHYRRAPRHRFPAALEDARTAYFKLIQQGTPPEKIALAGDSAGGGLCVSLMLSLRDENKPLPSCAYLMSPWLDLENCDKSRQFEKTGKRRPSDQYIKYMALLYAGRQDRKNPLISPVFGDLQGLSPMLVQTGKYEPLNREAETFSQKALEQGGDVRLNLYPSNVHVLQGLGGSSDLGRSLLREGGKFLKEHLEN